MVPLRGLFFDFGGTLDGPGLAWPQRLQALSARVLPDAPTGERFLRAFYDSDDNLLAREPGLRSMDLAATVDRQVFWTLKHLGVDSESARREIATAFLDEARSHLRAARGVLQTLGRGHVLGVVSNFYGNLEAILRGEDLWDLFAVVAESERVGCVKPDPAIFEHALRGAGVAAGESLMVGDNVKRDVIGARDCGMQAAWLKAAAGLPDGIPRPPEGTLILDSLAALPGALARRELAVLN